MAAPVTDEPRRLWRKNDADYEAAHGMEPLEDIHAEEAGERDDYIALAPLHGPRDRWEKRRKIKLALVKKRLRLNWDTEVPGVKMTEAALDDWAHADESYVEFVEAGIADGSRYEDLELRRANRETRAYRGQVIGRLRTSEAHMEPAGA